MKGDGAVALPLDVGVPPAAHVDDVVVKNKKSTKKSKPNPKKSMRDVLVNAAKKWANKKDNPGATEKAKLLTLMHLKHKEKWDENPLDLALRSDKMFNKSADFAYTLDFEGNDPIVVFDGNRYKFDQLGNKGSDYVCESTNEFVLKVQVCAKQISKTKTLLLLVDQAKFKFSSAAKNTTETAN